ncbi:protein adenylyltransferase SelO [Sulfurimonas sp.]|uniref:protein adenylyltransferase SelO n=1 Tax=Sulfurimonas sp. TaxID=2022749 RepID=UPI0025DEB400|nr:YdiU family protein [Sulfurimonas sp.]MDD5157041.1 YdiU family protein [Sulfurimonas sp.]
MKFSNLKLTTPYLNLEPIFYCEVEPSPLKNPFVISVSDDAARLLGVDEELMLDDKLLEIINGTKKLKGSKPFAMCYAGHQFGYFVPRLGDGRAINLGKVNGQNLQLKGAGQTLYSRHGDGRAVLRSSIREYLISEAMYGLGIATSRALAIIGSDSDVARQTWEKGAIVLRLSPTWIRFGTFEYFYAKGDYERLQLLADYVIGESFAHLKNTKNLYLEMYKQIVKNTAATLAHWQSVGFNHGVMNTDNMSIDGRTIDYGPFAFLDDYESNYVCNHTDTEGRYSFKNQPGIAHWNLAKLANALSPIINYEHSLEVLEEHFGTTYESKYLELMYRKMGLFDTKEGDIDLLKLMLSSLERANIDFSMFFYKLSTYSGKKKYILEIAVFQEPLQEWLESYDERLRCESLRQDRRHEEMLKVNPKYVLKNHILQEAIEKAERHDFGMVNDLLKVALNPFGEHKDLEYLAKPTPLSSKNIKLSCSS